MVRLEIIGFLLIYLYQYLYRLKYASINVQYQIPYCYQRVTCSLV